MLIGYKKVYKSHIFIIVLESKSHFLQLSKTFSTVWCISFFNVYENTILFTERKTRKLLGGGLIIFYKFSFQHLFQL